MARHKNCYFYHGAYTSWQISSVQFSHSVMSDSLWPHELKHTRLPCPSPTSGVYSNSCPLSWWCHPTISSSVGPFSWLISVRNVWNTVSLENWWCIRCGWLEILYRYLSLVWTGCKNLAKKKNVCGAQFSANFAFILVFLVARLWGRRCIALTYLLSLEALCLHAK